MDITELYQDEWLNDPPYWYIARSRELTPVCSTPCPTERDCTTSVQVDGQCYFAYDVNYVQFGMLWNYCFGSNSIEKAIMNTFIWPHKFHEAGKSNPPAFLWADAGFVGCPSFIAPPTGKAKRCKNKCPYPNIYDDFGWHFGTDYSSE